MPPSSSIGKGNIQIIDISSGPFDKKTCSKPKTDFLKNLSDRGVKTIIRYYSDENNLPCKNVTKDERKLLHDSGFSLAIVYQFEGRTPGRYTKATGQKDSGTCLTKANAINQPDGSAIYFGIDADVGTHEPNGVLSYFDEINKAFGGRYQVGCYGAGSICKAVRQKGLVTFTWVPEAPAWSGTRDFMNDGDWTFYQNKTDMEKSGLSKGYGIEVDTDFINPKFDTIGAFDASGALVKYDKQEVNAIAQARRWVKPLRMPLLDKPQGREIGHMCVARSVRVLDETQNGWAQIDIDEDGQANGYCEAKHLLPLNQMPVWIKGCQPMPL